MLLMPVILTADKLICSYFHQLGYLKVDSKHLRIQAFLGLKKKVYSVYTQSEDGTGLNKQSKLKGIGKKSAHEIKLKNYSKCILSSHQIRSNFSKITSSRHKLYYTSHRKLALDGFDASAKYKNCGNCSTFYFSTGETEKCTSTECRIDRLLLKIWQRSATDV